MLPNQLSLVSSENINTNYADDSFSALGGGSVIGNTMLGSNSVNLTGLGGG